MVSAGDLVAMSEEELAEACVGVDWREEEESIIEAFAEKLPDEDLEPTWSGDDLGFRLDGVEYLLPLTLTPVDRYVAIGSLANVLAARYEVRLFSRSLQDDTHLLLILPRATWAELDRDHPGWAGARFQPLELGKDYFGGGTVPYTSTG